MICKNCGAHLADNTVFCTNCGNAVEGVSSYEETVVTAQPVMTDPGKTLGMVSMILGIASLVFSWVAAIPGLILANMATKKSEEAGFTNTMAKVGKITSIVGLILTVLYIVFLVLYYIFLFIVMMGSM